MSATGQISDGERDLLASRGELDAWVEKRMDALGYTGWDWALPISWVMSEDVRAWQYDVSGRFVWGYREASGICGEPVPLTFQAAMHLRRYRLDHLIERVRFAARTPDYEDGSVFPKYDCKQIERALWWLEQTDR